MDYLRLEKETNFKIKSTTRVIEFPDHQTSQIFTQRWATAAHLMGLIYKESVMGFGEYEGSGENASPKIRYEFIVEGKTDIIKELLLFINKTLDLVTDIKEWPNINE